MKAGLSTLHPWRSQWALGRLYVFDLGASTTEAREQCVRELGWDKFEGREAPRFIEECGSICVRDDQDKVSSETAAIGV